VNIAVVEDEDIFIEQIKQYFETYNKSSDIQINYTVYKNGLDFIQNYTGQYDAVFMDILMPKMGGMEAALTLRKTDEDIPIIFMTNVAQYAIEGYKVNALDFMLKPIVYQDIELKLNKVIHYLQRFGSSGIMLTIDESSKMISTRDIYYIEVFNHQLVYHTKLGDFTQRGSLSALEQSDKFNAFIRSNSCYLVNCKHINSIEGECLKVNDTLLPISRRKKKEILNTLAKFMGGSL